MSDRELKDLLYDQVARMGKAASSPKRLELIEILVQGEKSVDQLAADAQISVKLASAHLKELRQAHLVESRREGRRIFYRLADPRVAEFWVVLRELAESRLLELQSAVREMTASAGEMVPLSGQELLEQARKGEVIVLDVRPDTEYATAHLPHARSIPLRELKQRLDELTPDVPIVAYCRGPYCLMARDAVAILGESGFRAVWLDHGVAEWRHQGLPLEQGPTDR